MSNWPLRKLSDVARLYGGSTPARDNADFWNGDIPWISPTELPMPGKGIQRINTTSERISQKGLDSSAATLLPAGTVVFSSRATIGKIGIAEVPLATNQGFVSFVPSKELLPEFLAYALLVYTDSIAGLAGSTTFKEVTRSSIRDVEIPVPPLTDQKRIISLLHEADALLRLRAESNSLLERLGSSVFPEMFGDPATNPKNWPRGVLGDVIHSAKDGPHVSPTYAESGVPFLSTRNVRAGHIVWDDLKYLSPDEAKIHWRKCKPERGDVLYTKGGTTGLAKAVDFDTEVAVWVHIAVLKTNLDKVDPVWLEGMLNTRHCYDQSQALTHGIANRDLGLKRMIDIDLYIPPLELQRVFSKRMAEISELETIQINSRQQLNSLFHSLLQSAFRGEL
jgi:type I restriction enzyme S subunit